MNPFSYQSIATGDYFYGRKIELRQLNLHISNQANQMIFSKRRMGKTSLVLELFKNKNLLPIYIDNYGITSEEQFGIKVLEGLSHVHKGGAKRWLKKLSKLLLRTRIISSVDLNNGEICLRPEVSGVTSTEMLDDFFNTVNQLANEQLVVVAFDEFQQISELKTRLDAKLRNYIQNSPNVTYIFMGSKRHMLNELFQYQSPLFEMATPFHVDAILYEDSLAYIQKHLPLEDSQVKYIISLSDQETKQVQHICNLLYRDYANYSQITRMQIDEALEEILNSKETSFRLIYDSMGQNQRKAFKLVAKFKRNLLSINILQKENISKSSMDTALKQLFKSEIIDKEQDTWFIPDRSLELWGQRFL